MLSRATTGSYRQINRSVIALLLLLLLSVPHASAAEEDVADGEVDELVEEVRGLSPVLADRRVEDLRAHIDRIEQTAHAVESDPDSPAGRTPEDGNYCYQCHGDGWEHFFNIGEDISTEGANEVCLDCHSGGDRTHWHGGAHEFQDMACIDCHNVHGEHDRLLREESQLELCSSCHQERRVDFNRPHHHPVREGQVACSDCHNPHGEIADAQLREGSVNDTCYQCHAEYRGPHLWEHQPVREDCTNCHDPHGSVHPDLLEARTAQLCQSCHVGHTPGQIRPDEEDEWYMGRGRGCLNCHSHIHGSNHPEGREFRR